MPRFYFMLMGLLLCNGMYAQQSGTIAGNISDGKKNISGAELQFDRNAGLRTSSDNKGRYTFTLDSGRHQLRITAAHYDTLYVNIYVYADSVSEKNIVLEPSDEVLETVEVAAGRYDRKPEDQIGSVEILRPGLISHKNTTSIETALEQVPGLTIIDNDPQIRGGSGFTFGVGSRVAVVVDGVPLLSGDAGKPDWTYIPVESIEEVDVIKGASSVLYGSSALNGVIHVRTAYPRSTPKTIVNYSVGVYSAPASPAANWYKDQHSFPGFTNLNLLHSRIIKNNLDLTVGANFNIDQGYIGPAPRAKYIPPDLRQALNMQDSIPVYSSNDMVKKRVRVNMNLRYRSKKITGLNYGVNTNFMANQTNMAFAWFDDSVNIYRAYPGALFLEKQLLFNVDPFIKYTDKKGWSHSLQTRVFYSNNQITNNQSTEGTLYYAEYQTHYKLKKTGLDITGGLVNNTAYSSAKLYVTSGLPQNRNQNAAAYVQLDQKLWKIVTLSGGIRYEHFKTNHLSSNNVPIYRGGANVQITRGTFLRSSYGLGYRYPTITERYITTKSGMFGVFANPDLKPEQSKSFEVGIKQGFKIGNCKGFFDVAYFDQHYKNNIEYLFGFWEPEIANVGFKFVNTGNSRVNGIDVSLAAMSPETNKRFGVSALIGYTYINPVSLTPDVIFAVDKGLAGGTPQSLSYKNSSMDTTGNVLKYRFKNMFKLDVETNIYRFAIGVSNRYYSRMQNIDKAFEDLEIFTTEGKNFFDVIHATRFWRAHRGISVWDFRISCKITGKQKVSFICNNVFNAIYALRPMKIEAPRTTSVQYVLNF